MPCPRGSIVVTGDVSVDHHIYMGIEPQESPTGKKPAVHEKLGYGGAPGLKDLLDAAMKMDIAIADKWGINLGIEIRPPTDLAETGKYQNGFAVWQLFPQEPVKQKNKQTADAKKVWRATEDMSYQYISDLKNQKTVPYRCASKPPTASDILVIDDLGFGFREQRECWLLPEGAAPRWIVLKMSHPVANGSLWNNLIERFGSRLICLVSASKLRQNKQCGYISRGLSWQSTVEDMRRQLLENPGFESLSRCRHLIVTFSVDGALWLDQRDPRDMQQTRATLIFDPEGAEAEWKDKLKGTIPSYSSIVAAAITYGVARALVRAEANEPLDLAVPIRAGLKAVRLLCELGHGRNTKIPEGFPTEDIAKAITCDPPKITCDLPKEIAQDPPKARACEIQYRFAQSQIPWSKKGAPLNNLEPWKLVEALERGADLEAKQELLELACDIVKDGTKALRRKHLPYARFGKLYTVNRSEIEKLRLLWRQMNQYRQRNQGTKPLSVGVFGDPGAGKSFGVEQIVEEVFGREERPLNFNLSQFNDVTDLLGAFHQVRDKALFGRTPIVFWDEFDCNHYNWVKYLLAPMQDGHFQEGKLTHSVGKSVFIFAGGIHSTYAKFAEAAEGLKSEKVPDFCSRLDAFYDVAGPNPRSENTPAETGWRPGTRRAVSHWLQRALMIRGVLDREGNPPKFSDPDLLVNLLRVREYKRGARSLEKLLTELRHKGGGTILWSDLPAPAFLGMHLDARDIEDLFERSEESIGTKTG
jgi:hypothetical protein